MAKSPAVEENISLPAIGHRARRIKALKKAIGEGTVTNENHGKEVWFKPKIPLSGTEETPSVLAELLTDDRDDISDYETLFSRERARANEEHSRAERLEEWASDAQHTIDKLRQALEIIAVGDSADAKISAREALEKACMWTKPDREQKS